MGDLPAPGVQGKSLLPLLKNPASSWKRPAFSQIKKGKTTGRSVRTERWRYTEWDEGKSGTELYDERNDPDEFTNLSPKNEYAKVVNQLSAVLKSNSLEKAGN